MSKRYIDRPPRIQPELPLGAIPIPPPPKDEQRQQPLWQSLVPVVSIVGYVLVSTAGPGSNVAFLLPMALMVLISTAITVFNTLRLVQRRQRAKADYARRLVEMRRAMVSSHNRQRDFYEYNYPATDVVLAMRGDHQDNRSGTRLWERRSNDEDFGYMRLGIGTRRSTVEYKEPQNQDSNEENEQMRDAERLHQDSRYVADVPITIPLYHHDRERSGPTETQRLEPAFHSIFGIAGSKQDVYEFVYALVAQFTAFHSPNDTILPIMGLPNAAASWLWASPLPHASLYFEDTELILAPVSGTVRQLPIKNETQVALNQLVAIIEMSDGSAVEVRAGYPGTIHAVVVKEGDEVEAGKLLVRLESFKITKQQLEDLQKAPSLYPLRGKKQKREIAGIPRFWKDRIWTELDRRARRLRDRDEKDQTDLTLPFMLILVDLLASRPGAPDDPINDSWLSELESDAAVSLLQGQGRQVGATMFVLVPQRNKVPSICQAVIELKRDANNQLSFLYAEVGPGSSETGRYVGVADKVTDTQMPRLATFAEEMSQWQVRRSYGADIPRTVDLLNLYDAGNITNLQILEKWRENYLPEKADWLKIPIGMLAGNEPRDLHFFADADGVHGMIAGANGSGKSELLMTLVLSLAIKYDPRVVNFVLIDYKGGAAFDPFRKLPHVVDVVTNLRGNAVARMFAAINAELNRRQRINQDTGMKDIVSYREEGLHRTRRDYYPHLFIIIDEFAEMIANNNEYKAQLDSIARLGRALGVSLILAAQRPSGVTDQMRANIKMKLCLRVETKEESSEMLKMPDASYLPSIPGRGYIQIGNESLQLIQVGFSGQYYTPERGDYDPLEYYRNARFVWEEDLRKPKKEKSYEVLVRRMEQLAANEYGTNQDKRPWRKPWPNPLPPRLALNATEGIEVNYLSDDDRDYIGVPADAFTLCPAITEWIEGPRKDWEPLDWANRAMHAVIGLVDDPSNAKLRLLEVDLSKGHHVLLGSAGYGKSTFLFTLLTYLVTTHSPNDLNLYLLDFGSRSLESFKPLPHTGAYILSHESERVTRFMRFLDRIIEERKETLSAADANSLAKYNISHPNAIIPAILVVIDNFAEFRDTYEQYLENMASLLREGLGVGVYFVVTGDQQNNFQKLFALIPERLVLKLSDESEYASILGRGARLTEDLPGRGVLRVERTSLEFQIAMPIAITENDPDTMTEQQKLRPLFEKMVQASPEGKFPKPTAITPMPEHIGIEELIAEYNAKIQSNGRMQQIILGRDDYDLSVKSINMEIRKHFVVTGPPASGKTIALYNWILSLARNYRPKSVGMVLIDYRRALSEYGGEQRLHDLPHILGNEVISTSDQLAILARHLTNEYVKDDAGRLPNREIYVIIDNYDDMKYLVKDQQNLIEDLAELARIHGKQGLHFVLSGLKQAMNADALINLVGRSQYGLAMSVDSAEGAPFYGSVPRIYSRMELPPGRGFIIVPGRVTALQVAMPSADERQKLDVMDRLVNDICGLYPNEKAEWTPLKADQQAAPPPATKNKELTPAQREALIDQVALRMTGGEVSSMAAMRDSLVGHSDQTLIDLAENNGIKIEELVTEQ